MLLRTLSSAACVLLLATSLHANGQAGAGPMGGMAMPQEGKKLPSPPATATATFSGQTVTIHYNSPSMRHREIFGGLVPYNQIWRTGANPATTLVTPVSLHIGTLLVPAGTYTLYSLPTADKWMLIVNKQTGQWGTEYHQEQDLGRVEMKSHSASKPQEMMSLSFEDTERNSAELHIRWANADESVKVTTP